MKKEENILFLVIDLFCGAGGTTSGFEEGEINGQKIAKVIACINHDTNAIMSHKANHPSAKHFIEDIRKFNPKKLVPIIDKWKRKYPNAKVILWASLECTNFSIAKGGLPRDADSRTLAEHLYKYIRVYKYDAVMIENVVEFMSWGKLDKNGKPISKDKGEDFLRWTNNVNIYGYNDHWGKLNAADYGATQSRKRLFGMFAADDFPVCFPQASHSKYPDKTGLKKWEGVRKDLDLDDEGESIFVRKKELSENTLKRIHAGLVKYVANGKDQWLTKMYSSHNNTQVNKGADIDDPSPTITTFVGMNLAKSVFISKYYGNGENVTGVDEVCGTLTTKDRMGVVTSAHFIDKQFTSGTHNHQSIDVPLGAITTVPKSNVVKCWLINSNSSTSPAVDINNPSPTITCGNRTHYLVNPSWFGADGSIDKPCCTIVARQDKAPISIVNVELGEIMIPVYENDSEYMIKIKEFMAAYGIVDIKMRMLKIPELLRIQGFKNGYELIGTKTQQKKYIGNAVVPLVVRRWIESIGMEVIKQQKQAA